MSDDLLAIAAGLTSGIEKIAVPYFQMSYQDRLAQAKEKRTLEQTRMLNNEEREDKKVDVDEIVAPRLGMKPGKYHPSIVSTMGSLAGKDPRKVGRQFIVNEKGEVIKEIKGEVGEDIGVMQIKSPGGKAVYKKSEVLAMTPEQRASLPEGHSILDDTPKGDSRTTDQKLRELKQQLAILTTFKDKYKKIGQGPVAKSGTMINKARGQSTPATRYEDQRGAVALNLWSAWTGEKGKFSTTDQELAFGLVPGQYEKGGESKFDDAISLAEFGISELQKGNDLPAIYSAISQFGGKSAGRIKVPGLTGGVSGSGLTPEQRRARIAELQAEPAR